MLSKESKLYFLHIPKTAGTSIRYWLWDAFAVEDFLECHDLRDLEAVDSSQIAKAFFYSGHFGPLLWQRLASRPATVTFLREPVAQVFSTIHYLRSRSEAESQNWGIGTWALPLFIELARREDLSSLLKHASYVNAFSNLQVRFLSGDIPQNGALNPVTRAMYDRARLTLETLEAVGLVERMQESLLLIAGQLGWPPRALPYKLNQTPANGRDAIDAMLNDNLALIRETNSWDLKLYDFGRQLFDGQLDALRRKLGLAGGETEAENRGLEPLRSALLERFLDSPLDGQALRYGRLTHSSRFFLDGWEERVYWPPVKRWLRWAGRAGKSTLYLPLQRTNGPKVACFEIIYSRDETILKSLEIYVDDERVPITHMDVKQGDDIYFHVCEIELPQLLSNAAKSWTAISFVLASADDGTVDPGERPFALGNIELF
jgi:hypothetical protein